MTEPIFPIPPGTRWFDGHRFQDRGGWTVDDQFIDQMGSPCLLAIGYGTPVAPARTRLPEGMGGSYRAWIHTRDWLPEFHPGPLAIQLDGKRLPGTFGVSGREGWVWEDVGVHAVSAGAELSVVDLAGYYGRFDAVVFCPDVAWTPPGSVADLTACRTALGLLAAETTEWAADVVVVGGGLAGCLAAIAAARGGARTVLLHNRRELGGNASTENLVPPVGAMQNLIDAEDRDLDPRETGILEELAIEPRQRYVEVGKDYPPRLRHLLDGEANLTLHLGFHVDGVDTEGDGAIRSVTARDLASGARHRFQAPLFVDATGDGLVGIRAGAQFAFGREGRSVYGETKAPETGNEDTLGSSLKYWCEASETEVPFTAPPWVYGFPTCESIHKDKHPSAPGFLDRQWVVELGGEGNSHTEAEAVRDRLLRLIWGLYDHMKNHCPRGEVSPSKLKMAWVGHVVARRESWRLLGDHVLTEQDVVGQTEFPDAVAFGGWGLDDHPSDGFFSKELNDHTHGGIFFSIPWRCLYSRNIPNLLLAGRNISASHVAFSATRVMRTTALMGQAVGTAAALCLERGLRPRALGATAITALQQRLLKDGAFVLGVPNQDPDDLARGASVKATAAPETAPVVIAGWDRARFKAHGRNAARDLRAWIPGPGGGSLLLEFPTAVRFNVMHLVFQSDARTPPGFTLETMGAGGWENIPGVPGGNLRRRLVFCPGDISTRSLRLNFPAAEKPWGLCQIRLYRESDATRKALAKRQAHTMAWPPSARLPWERGDDSGR